MKPTKLYVTATTAINSSAARARERYNIFIGVSR